MDLSRLIQHVEELIYQLVVLLVSIPKTLRRVAAISWTLARGPDGRAAPPGLWILYAEPKLFSDELNTSWLTGLRRTIGTLLLAFGIFFGLEILVISAFQGLAVWR
jgi:hypothetical protein